MKNTAAILTLIVIMAVLGGCTEKVTVDSRAVSDGLLEGGTARFSGFNYSMGVYEGEWLGDAREGSGIATYYDAADNIVATIEGIWADDQISGPVTTVIYEDGSPVSMFEGTYLNGAYDSGTLTNYVNYPNYRKEFSGTFEDFKVKGQGTLKFFDSYNYLNYVYEGGLSDNQKNGSGSITFMGSHGISMKYEGEWLNDYRNGQGTSTYYEGNVPKTVFIGTHADDYYTQGTLITYVNYPNYRFEYTGPFSGFKPNGSGRIEFYDSFNKLNTVYEGQVLDGLRCGQGTLTVYDGYGTAVEVYEGVWEADVLPGYND